MSTPAERNRKRSESYGTEELNRTGDKNKCFNSGENNHEGLHDLVDHLIVYKQRIDSFLFCVLTVKMMRCSEHL